MAKELESHKLEEEKEENLQYYVFLHRIRDLCNLSHGIRFKFILAFP